MRLVDSVLTSSNSASAIKLAFNTSFILMLLNLLSNFFPSELYSIFALIIFGIYLIGMSRYSRVAFILLLSYIFFRVTTLFSTIGIEFGAEMPELDMFGEATGATIRLAIVYVFFITVAAVVIERWYEVINNTVIRTSVISARVWVSALLFFVILLSFTVLYIGGEVGYPMLTGVSRLAFREDVDSKIFLLYISNRNIIVVLLGLVIATSSDMRRKISIGCFILILIVSLLFGEKFTSLISMLVFIMTPSLILNRQLQSFSLTRLIIILIFGAALTVPVILSVYGWSDDPAIAIERLVGRFAGQGQLWYVADRDTGSMFEFDLQAFQHNLKSFSSLNGSELSNVHPHFGAKYFMFKYMNDSLLFLFLETKALSLTFGFEPYMLVTNGWAGQLLPLTLCAIIYASNLSYLLFGLIKRDPVSVFLAMKIFIWVNIALQQGELWLIFGIKTLLVVVLCFVYERLLSGRRIYL